MILKKRCYRGAMAVGREENLIKYLVKPLFSVLGRSRRKEEDEQDECQEYDHTQTKAEEVLS